MTRINNTVELVASYVANNPLPAADLPRFIATTHSAIANLGTEEIALVKPSQAEIRASIQPDALISFIDGKPYKTLKRHLTTNGLTPHLYRQRYGLPSDYPMVAASYSAWRSELAKAIGLGVPAAKRGKKVAPKSVRKAA